MLLELPDCYNFGCHSGLHGGSFHGSDQRGGNGSWLRRSKWFVIRINRYIIDFPPYLIKLFLCCRYTDSSVLRYFEILDLCQNFCKMHPYCRWFIKLTQSITSYITIIYWSYKFQEYSNFYIHYIYEDIMRTFYFKKYKHFDIFIQISIIFIVTLW